MRSIRHWNRRYVRARIQRAVRERLRPNEPWITSAATYILNQLLRNTDVGVEWGSGRSTAWLAQRVAQLRTIENSPDWNDAVARMLASSARQNVVQRLCTSQAVYESAAADVADQSVDFAFVDGAFDRGRYALEAVRITKAGGLIIVDDAHRYLPSSSHSPYARAKDSQPASNEWAAFWATAKHWRRIWTSDDLSDTLILFAQG